ncbi:MAG: BlaR1 peptidase [Mucilaginibacter sp.]|nr:BlaR1 peptidase [Mucilaginibacter sp.]
MLKPVPKNNSVKTSSLAFLFCLFFVPVSTIVYGNNSKPFPSHITCFKPDTNTNKTIRQDASFVNLCRHVARAIQYPRIARQNNTTGTAVFNFDILADGTIGNITVVKSLGDGCEEAVISALKSFNDTKHLIKEGNYNIPVVFGIDNLSNAQREPLWIRQLPNLLNKITITAIHVRR